MKKYCLKPGAKEKLTILLSNIIDFLGLVLFLCGLIALPAALMGAEDRFANSFKYIGILSYTAVFSLIAIEAKRWLQSNITEY